MTIARMVELMAFEHACMLRNSHGDCDRDCDDCNLVQDDSELHEMYTSVISLLKTQVPKALTLEEYKSMAEVKRRDKRPVWIEWFDGTMGGWSIPQRAYEGYGMTWRAWTGKPIDGR